MGKVAKIFGFLLLLLVIAVVGLSLFVRYFLTEERIKALVVPEAEKVLNRTVAIGKIESSLFSGITINNFSIKEQDGKTDFLYAKAFVLRYNLWPLLNKKVQISELRLEQPAVRIFRTANGSFNYETLAVLAEKEEKAATQQITKGGEAALPIALSVDQITVQNASFHLEDELGQLPTVDALADLKVRVSLGQSLDSLSYAGILNLEGSAVYGETKPTVSGRISFDEKNLDYSLQLVADEQTLNADGSAGDYRTAPKIALDLTSKELDVDKLLALATGLPKSSEEKPAPVKDKGTATSPIAASLPSGLTASGKIAIEKAIYRGMDINALLLRYSLANGILHIRELGAVAMGGSLTGAMESDLNRIEPPFKGNIDLSSVQAAQLSGAFAKRGSAFVSGSLQSSVNFAGTGFDWDTLQNTLTANGNYALADGQIKETPLTTTISALLGMPQLKNIAFSDLSGNFRVLEGGKVELKSSLHSSDIQAESTGRLGLDGTIDLPLTLKFSPKMSSKLGGQAKFTKLLQDSAGNTVLNLKVAGTLDKPHPTIDAASVQKQVTDTLKDKLIEELERKGSTEDKSEGSESPPKPVDILKGLFK